MAKPLSQVVKRGYFTGFSGRLIIGRHWVHDLLTTSWGSGRCGTAPLPIVTQITQPFARLRPLTP
jgi:hypothetical protein